MRDHRRARQALIAELGLDGLRVATSFLRASTGHRVRRGGVRASLARLAGRLAGTPSAGGLRYGNFDETRDEVVLYRAVVISVSAGLLLPVRSTITLPFAQFIEAAVNLTAPKPRSEPAYPRG